MGNITISSSSRKSESANSSSKQQNNNGKVWLFFHRTWTIMTAERWTTTRHQRRQYASSQTNNSDECHSQYSQYSMCSCSQCRRSEDGYSCSDLISSYSSMVPYSEEEELRMRRISYLEEPSTKDKQRPPIYNPEDYATLLRKWGKKTTNGLLSLYSNASTIDLEGNKVKHLAKDYRNPMLTGSEMTLRQFGSISELLAKLKMDLRMAYPSFVQEFVADPLDGVSLLLDLLRAIQLSQSSNQDHSASGTTKMPPSLQRRTLLDELSCLQCLHSCCSRYSDAVRKLTMTSAGLFTLAICIMSNVNKSRILALQLLSKACGPPANGHVAVSEAMSTLRLRFGEPVRFRFLAGMLTSACGQKELLSAGMEFLNSFASTSSSKQDRIYIQAELDQAGFDIDVIKKNVGSNVGPDEAVLEEIRKWEKQFIDVDTIQRRLVEVERENNKLRDKMTLLERKVKVLQEEKGVLINLEQCLKDKCSELQGEVHSLKSEKSLKKPIYSNQVKDESGPEDEGISSSECSPTPDDEDDPQHRNLYKQYRSDHLNSCPIVSTVEDEEETTIEEVIEELQNIVNDAQSDEFKRQELLKFRERKLLEEAQIAGKIQMQASGEEYVVTGECEIVPTKLNPQPPRRAKSLLHLFSPTEDYGYCNKELFFENETAYSSEEGSDSLLSASRCFLMPSTCPKDKKTKPPRASIKRSESFKHIPKALSVVQVNTKVQQQKPVPEPRKKLLEVKSLSRCKSFERIDKGLDGLVDIVVTDNVNDKMRSKSDSGNASGTSLCRSVSNVFLMGTENKSKMSTHSEEKQKMFLPIKADHFEVPYYFPRIQERQHHQQQQRTHTSSSAGFLIKRGHTNAGLYSGQVMVENHQHMMMAKSREVITFCSSNASGKLSDFPSGLY